LQCERQNQYSQLCIENLSSPTKLQRGFIYFQMDDHCPRAKCHIWWNSSDKMFHLLTMLLVWWLQISNKVLQKACTWFFLENPSSIKGIGFLPINLVNLVLLKQFDHDLVHNTGIEHGKNLVSNDNVLQINTTWFLEANNNVLWNNIHF
jgi:hypothetical protein